MKIVQCFYALTIGGAEILGVDLLNEMCKKHECTLIIVNNIWNTEVLAELDKRVKVYFINREEGSRNPLPILKFNLLILKLRPDVIHCHEPKMAQIIKFKPCKLVYTIHDTGIPTDLYHKYDSLVAISDAVHKDVAERYDKPIKRVYNGINAGKFDKRTEYSLGNEAMKLVQVSRVIHEKKGQDILLQALAMLKKDHGFQDFIVHIVGVGPSLDYLKQLAVTLDLKDQVVFCGGKDRPWLYQNLRQYHLLVQPSRYEGFGLTILEGFAAGLPVLASNIEGPAEIMRHTQRGELFEKEDVKGCAEKIWHFVEAYRNNRLKTIFEHHPPITDTEYSIQRCAEGYIDEYRSLLEKS